MADKKGYSDKEIKEVVIKGIRDISCGVPLPILLSTNLSFLGLDSLDVVELAMYLEEYFNITEFSEEEVYSWRWVSNIVMSVENKL